MLGLGLGLGIRVWIKVRVRLGYVCRVQRSYSGYDTVA